MTTKNIIAQDKPQYHCWLVCLDCSFEMRCDSQLDAFEIAQRHLLNYARHCVDFCYTVEAYLLLMRKRPEPPTGQQVPANRVHHKSDTRRKPHSRRLL